MKITYKDGKPLIHLDDGRRYKVGEQQTPIVDELKDRGLLRDRSIGTLFDSAGNEIGKVTKTILTVPNYTRPFPEENHDDAVDASAFAFESISDSIEGAWKEYA